MKEKFAASKSNNKAKNVPRICIKLCAAGIFGCRIRICSIWCASSRFLDLIKTLVYLISALHNNSMNKADLVNSVSAQTGETKTVVSSIVDATIKTIVDSVVDGKKVSILGFGSFEPRDRSARQGLNPKTGEKIAIPAKRVPTFSAGKQFKDSVQG